MPSTSFYPPSHSPSWCMLTCRREVKCSQKLTCTDALPSLALEEPDLESLKVAQVPPLLLGLPLLCPRARVPLVLDSAALPHLADCAAPCCSGKLLENVRSEDDLSVGDGLTGYARLGSINEGLLYITGDQAKRKIRQLMCLIWYEDLRSPPFLPSEAEQIAVVSFLRRLFSVVLDTQAIPANNLPSLSRPALLCSASKRRIVVAQFARTLAWSIISTMVASLPADGPLLTSTTRPTSTWRLKVGFSC